MNKRKRKGKEGGSTKEVDKGVVEPFRKRKSNLLKLAFSVLSDKNDGVRYLYTLLSTLRDNAYLPVLATHFSERHIDSLIYIDEEETAIFMDRNVDVFQHIIARLRVQTIDISLVPKGVDADEWEAELDYWGYSIPEIQVEPPPESRHSELGNRIDLQAQAILSILKKYMYERGVEMRLQSGVDSNAKLVMWFLDSLSFRTPELEDYPVMKVADWLRKWGSQYIGYFKKELDVSDFVLILKPADPKRGVLHSTCKWPSHAFQIDYKMSKTGHVEVELYFSLGAQKVK